MKSNFDQYIEKALSQTENAQKSNLEMNPSVSKKLEENKLTLINIFHNSSDITIKEFSTGSQQFIKGFVFYLSDLVDEDMLAQHVLHTLLQPKSWDNLHGSSSVIDMAYEKIIDFGKIKKEEQLKNTVQAVVNGCAVIFFEGSDQSLVIDLEKRQTRSIPQPQYEASVFGPQQAFVENVKTNLSLIRNIIRSPLLIAEKYAPKCAIKTNIYLLYLNGVANTNVLKILRKRLDAMQTALILDSASIKGYISDKRHFPFDTVGLVERPDKTAAKIMEGKIALLCDGSPFALTVPFLFIEEFHQPEDYYLPAFFASFGRLLRFVSFLITLLAAPVYIAAATFHQEIFPLTLLITATASRENTPFPTLVEALLMMGIFDILREGGIRAPRPVGQTVSFIGALIIGTAAVDAGVFSAPMVIITSLGGITALLNYSLKNETIFFRTLLLFSSGFMGFFGIETVAIMILIRMCTIQSFGISFLSPASPYNGKAFFRDTFIRFPIKALSYLWNNTQNQRQ